MAEKKNHWYIMVLTTTGPRFVTEICYFPHKEAHWDKLGTPLELSKSQAQEVALGLCVNGHLAYSVCQLFEIDHQPYFYDKGKFRWETDEVNLDRVVDWISEHDGVFEDFKKAFPKIAELIKKE